MPAVTTGSVSSAASDFTCTLNGLLSSATGARQATRLAIDQSNGPLSHLIQLTAVIGAGTIGGDRRIYVYVWGSLAANVYPSGFGANDGAVTLLVPTELFLLHTLAVPNSEKTYTPTFDTSRIWPNGLPPYYGVAVRNYCGIALASGSKISYSEKRLTTL